MPRQREDDDDRPEEPREDSPLGPPRRRRRRRDEDYDDENDVAEGVSTIIPYKNGYALAAYYTGVFSLIPCVGAILSVIAIVLGFMGLSYVKKHPTAHGTAHAIVGLVLGFLVLLGHLGAIAFFAILIAASPHR